MKPSRSDILHFVSVCATIGSVFLLVPDLFPKAIPFFRVIIGVLLAVLGMVFYLLAALLMKITFRSGAPILALLVYLLLLGGVLMGSR